MADLGRAIRRTLRSRQLSWKTRERQRCDLGEGGQEQLDLKSGEHQRFDPPLHPECTNTGTTVEPFTPYCSRGKSPEGKHLDVALVGAAGPPAHTNSVHVHPQEPPTVLQNPSTLATKHTGRGCKTTGHSRARMEMSSSSCLCIGYGEGHQLPLSWPKCTLIRSHKPPATVGQ